MEKEIQTVVGFSSGMVEILHIENGERLRIRIAAAAAKDLGVSLIENAALVVVAAKLPDNIELEAPVIVEPIK